MPFQTTPAHQVIFDFLQSGTGSAIIDAVAGAGKTSTLIEGFGRIAGNAIFLAFNKSIATALQARCPSHVSARTFHSLCYNPVLKSMGIRQVNVNKIDELLSTTLSETQYRMYASFIKRLIGLARNAGLDAIEPLNGERLYALVELHDLQLENERASEAEAIELARRTLEVSNREQAADFDDLLYFAVKNGVKLPRFDWVFVDEAQDTNAIQRAILRKLMGPNSRLVAVGDAAQSIYGFRGADSEAMNILAAEFNCQRFPLSVTYRCAQSIVRFAQQFVPEITAATGAPEGSVTEPESWEPKEIVPGDLVVCRNVKPLLGLGYAMLRQRLPVKILGSEIGNGLVTLLGKCSRGTDSIDEATSRIEAWRDREVEKALSRKQEAKADAIEDKANTLIMLAEELPENARTVAELTRVLRELFAEKVNAATLSTVHKAKGLEAHRVWWLCPSLCPSKWAKQPWQIQQEQNIQYVAVTRAARELRLIEL
jgi:DNA helicase-2/ATP-dependent DNA helicase PcrA